MQADNDIIGIVFEEVEMCIHLELVNIIMRHFIHFIIALFPFLLYGQDDNFNMPDSLAVTQLPYETLDLNAIKAAKPWINIHLRTIVCFDTNDGLKLAYYTSDKNKWTVLPLPFSRWTNNFDTCNLDGNGQPEIIVRGDDARYGIGGGTATTGMIIINIDSIPTQIFNVDYGCMGESFGGITKKGFVKSYKRTIKIKNQSIIISELDKKKYPFPECGLTEIPAGTYVMTGGKIRRKK